MDRSPIRPALQDKVRRRSCIIVALVVVSLSLQFSCSGAPPTGPDSGKYQIYVWVSDLTVLPAKHYLYIYKYDADTLSLAEVEEAGGYASEAVAAADGSALFVLLDLTENVFEPNYQLHRVDPETRAVEWQVSASSGSLQLLRDGMWLVNDHEVRSTTDGELVKSLPDSLHIGYGDPEGSALAAIIRGASELLDDDTVVTSIDVVTGETVGSYVQPRHSGRRPAVYLARLHPDHRRVLTLSRTAYYESWMAVGDLETGATLLEVPIRFPYGDIAINAAGTLAAVSDPSRPGTWETTATVDIVDLESLTVTKRLTMPDDIDRVSELWFLPDGEHLVTRASFKSMQVIDAVNSLVSDTVAPQFPGAIMSAITAIR